MNAFLPFIKKITHKLLCKELFLNQMRISIILRIGSIIIQAPIKLIFDILYVKLML